MVHNAKTLGDAVEALPPPIREFAESAMVAFHRFRATVIVPHLDDGSTVPCSSPEAMEGDAKRFLQACATDLMLDSGAKGYGFAMEAWEAPESELEPRHHPERKTVWIFGGVSPADRGMVQVHENEAITVTVADDDTRLGGDFFDLLPTDTGKVARVAARERIGLRKRLGKIAEVSLGQ